VQEGLIGIHCCCSAFPLKRCRVSVRAVCSIRMQVDWELDHATRRQQQHRPATMPADTQSAAHWHTLPAVAAAALMRPVSDAGAGVFFTRAEEVRMSGKGRSFCRV